jgi:hypothetical protein
MSNLVSTEEVETMSVSVTGGQLLHPHPRDQTR